VRSGSRCIWRNASIVSDSHLGLVASDLLLALGTVRCQQRVKLGTPGPIQPLKALRLGTGVQRLHIRASNIACKYPEFGAPTDLK